MKNTNAKKILLGSAMAGLVLAGPGLTAGGHLFQIADLGVGYRLAQGEEAANPQVGDRGSGQEKKEADYKQISDQDAQAAAAEREAKKEAKDAAKVPPNAPKGAAEKACGAGACG